MNGRPSRRNKASFPNFSGTHVVWPLLKLFVFNQRWGRRGIVLVITINIPTKVILMFIAEIKNSFIKLTLQGGKLAGNVHGRIAGGRKNHAPPK